METDPTQEQSINEHMLDKREYMESLKQNIWKLAELSNLETFGIFEKIRDVVPEHMINNRNSILIESVTQKGEEFIDVQYPPTMENLAPLKRPNMKFISWFRIK